MNLASVWWRAIRGRGISEREFVGLSIGNIALNAAAILISGVVLLKGAEKRDGRNDESHPGEYRLSGNPKLLPPSDLDQGGGLSPLQLILGEEISGAPIGSAGGALKQSPLVLISEGFDLRGSHKPEVISLLDAEIKIKGATR